jgi:hypothetical protein
MLPLLTSEQLIISNNLRHSWYGRFLRRAARMADDLASIVVCDIRPSICVDYAQRG